MKTHDTRRWPQEPHLSVSLMYLRDILAYLHRRHIHVYRFAAEVHPFAAHPNVPEYRRQVEECAEELAHVGELARRYGIRLTVHAPAYVVLASPDSSVVQRSVDVLSALADLMDAMGLGPESVIVVHIGGGYDAPAAAMDRFCHAVEGLPELVRRRLAVEHDDTTFDLNDALTVHSRVGLPVVFDLLHYRLLDRSGLPLTEAVRRALDTWPPGVTPKVHLASPSTAMRVVERRNPVTGKRFTTVHPPLLSQHSDFVHPFDAVALFEAIGDRPVDIMVEARAGDLAVGRLIQNLWRVAPHVAGKLAQRASRRLAEAEPTYSDWAILEGGEVSPEDDARVLVVIMNNLRDFEIVRDEGWYRIPVKRAPRQVAADYLAFYMTRVFEEDRWSIPYIAPVIRYKLARRIDLLPEEPDHPRAYEWYHKVELGPLRRLARPVPSRRLRRVTFIPTTLRRLLEAEEINDLWMGPEVQEQLHAALAARHVAAERHYVVAEGGTPYRADMAIPCVDGGVAVRFGKRVSPESVRSLQNRGWSLVLLDPDEAIERLDETTEKLLDEVREHGGERRHEPTPAM